MESLFSFNPNPLVRYLQKPAELFTREDLIKFVEGNQIQQLNFRYVAADGRLKTLNFIITGHEHLESILTFGERVDGSSLFPFMETGSSDLYVIPRYRTAFLNPFADVPSLEILCSFFDYQGKPLELSPEYVLQKAISNFRVTTGLNMKMMGELEYYVNSKNEGIFPATDQKGYHESEPFAKYEGMRKEALRLIASCGAKIKYGHSEVGNFTVGDESFEQHEIEFLPTDPEFAADQLVIAKWILRMLAEKRRIEISFAPKITIGKAGSGLHFHMLVEKDGKNIVMEDEKLSGTARKMIAGIMDAADALTAFGNTIPTSYLRLVPNQEAPTKICWGDRNRSALVRVPLGWTGKQNMAAIANPDVHVSAKNGDSRQTFEFRVPDGSANIHLIMAGLIVASLHGINMPEALQMADQLYVEGNIFRNIPAQKLQQLPASCVESGKRLNSKREIFENSGVFPKQLIDYTVESLTAFQDENLANELKDNPEATRALVIKYIHCQ
jgi:glutamine synthetase